MGERNPRHDDSEDAVCSYDELQNWIAMFRLQPWNKFYANMINMVVVKGSERMARNSTVEQLEQRHKELTEIVEVHSRKREALGTNSPYSQEDIDALENFIMLTKVTNKIVETALKRLSGEFNPTDGAI